MDQPSNILSLGNTVINITSNQNSAKLITNSSPFLASLDLMTLVCRFDEFFNDILLPGIDVAKTRNNITITNKGEK